VHLAGRRCPRRGDARRRDDRRGQPQDGAGDRRQGAGRGDDPHRGTVPAAELTARRWASAHAPAAAASMIIRMITKTITSTAAPATIPPMASARPFSPVFLIWFNPSEPSTIPAIAAGGAKNDSRPLHSSGMLISEMTSDQIDNVLVLGGWVYPWL